MIKEAQRIQGIEQYYFAQKLGQIKQMDSDGGQKVLNLGIGSPDLLPPKNVIETMNKAANKSDANKYQSYTGIDEIRQELSNWYKHYFEVTLDPTSEILPLLGSKEGVMHISMAFLSEGDEVLVPNPGYPAYATCAKIAGASVIAFELKQSLGWKPDLDKLKSKDLSKVKIMWINYPNMPTGATVDVSFYQELADFGRDNQILICNDNPYSFILNDNPISILQVKQAFPWVLELSSLSKNYNMAGWRIGAVSAHKDIIKSILKFKSNMDSGMYKPLQIAAIEALKTPIVWNKSNNEVYLMRKKSAIKLLEKVGCTIEASHVGMFVWAKVPNGKDGNQLSNYLLDQFRIFITPGFIFGDAGNDYIRISLCSPEDVFLEALNRINNNKNLVA